MKTLACLIIAAGNSSRLGQPKQLVLRNGESLLRSTINFAESISPQVVCVLGFGAERMTLELMDTCASAVVNHNWQQGMGSSIATGVKALDNDVDAIMVMLCDQWQLTQNDFNKLVQSWSLNPQQITASEYFDKRKNQSVIGAPAIFPQRYFSELCQLKDVGAKFLIEKHEEFVCKVKLANAAYDLDLVEDLAEFKRINANKI